MFSAVQQFFNSSIPEESNDPNITDNAEGLSTEKADETEKKEAVEPLGDFSLLTDKLNMAKDWGSQIYKKVTESSGNTVQLLSEKIKMDEIGAQVKTALDKLPAVSDFQKLQSKFEEEQLSKCSPYAPSTNDSDMNTILPWHPATSGFTDEVVAEKLRTRILALSQQPNTFLLALPEGAGTTESVDILDSDEMRLARAMLKEDTHLEHMRYKLVPSRISEDLFWRNYFYRVSMVCQSMQLSAMAGTTLDDASDFVRIEPEASWENEKPTTLNTSANGKAPASFKQSRQKKTSRKNKKPIDVTSPDAENDEADTILVVKEPTEEELEAELAREVDEMVLVPSSPKSSAQSDELDRELEMELLAEIEPNARAT